MEGIVAGAVVRGAGSVIVAVVAEGVAVEGRATEGIVAGAVMRGAGPVIAAVVAEGVAVEGGAMEGIASPSSHRLHKLSKNWPAHCTLRVIKPAVAAFLKLTLFKGWPTFLESL